MHYGAVCLDWSADDVVVVLEIHDNDFRLGIIVQLLTNTYVMVRL